MSKSDPILTHINEAGEAHMVSIGEKESSKRTATAACWVRMRKETLEALVNSRIPKGDALAVARIAGIQAAKETSRAIPLCHPLPLTQVEIRLTPLLQENKIIVESTCACDGKTGVEMEALHAASVAALSLYDMLKAIDKEMVIEGLRVTSKTGGKSGSQYQDPLES